jgi:2-amino-4-hydroxy-6-hydroxymethyldihydropteridine diphosphokinase
MTATAVRADSPSASTVYIGLGSNLEEPAKQVRRALEALGRLPQTRLLGVSRLYRNPAIGPGEQPDYVNAVAAIETSLEPHALLDALLAIEAEQGRVRTTVRWQSRTLDLDVLLYGRRVIDDDRLTVPHQHLHERAFVLKPLLEIAPDLHIPGLGDVKTLLAGVPDAGLRPVDDGGESL